MGSLPRQLLLGVCAVALAVAFAGPAHGETAPVVVGLAKCSDCSRKNMNAEAAFKGLKVAVKCKNSNGEYESKAMGEVDRTGTFSVPLAADLVGEDGELKQDCLAQLHSASSAPCPGQDPSKIVAAQPGKKTFVALGGEMHRPSAECASAFLCDPFHKHLHHLIFHKPAVVAPPKHDIPVPPVVKPPVTVPEHKPPATPVYTPTPTTPVYTPTPPKPTPIYHPPAQHDTINGPQQFKRLIPLLKKLPFFPPGVQESKP